MDRAVVAFVAGELIGVAVGVLATSWFTHVIEAQPLVFTTAIAALVGVGGFLAGRRSTPKHEMRLTGRVFDFPQGSVMVEVALRRMRSILPTKVTEE